MKYNKASVIIPTMLERITSKITRKDRIPVCKERANYYRQRAVINSIRNGVLDFLDDKTPGQELIDPVDTVALSIPETDQKLEFAFDENGLAFARIENGKYYPIKLEDSEGLLKIAADYDKDASSVLRRFAYTPLERFDDSLFHLKVSLYNLDDVLTKWTIRFHEKIWQRTFFEDAQNQERSEDIILLPAAEHSFE